MNLKNKRKVLKLTQKELAKKNGITTATYALYKQGKREPNIEMLKTLANFLKYSIDELVDRKIG